MHHYSGLSEPNVKFILIFTFMHWFAGSIINQNFLAAYVHALTNSDTQVSIVKGIQVVMQLAIAIPAGYAGDCWRRDRVLLIASSFGLFSCLVSGIALQLENIEMIWLSSGCWGIFASLQIPALEAIFADSVPHGQKSLPFTFKFVIMNLGLALGLLCGIVFNFYQVGIWELAQLRTVIYIGVFIEAFAMIPLMYLNDASSYESRQKAFAIEQELRSIGRQFEAELSDSIRSGCKSPAVHGFAKLNEMSSKYCSELSLLIRSPYGSVISPGEAYMSYISSPSREIPMKTRWSRLVESLCDKDVPYFLLVTNLIISLGSGISVNYSLLFFLGQYKLSPIQMQALYLSQSACAGIFSCIAQWKSRKCGRIPIIVFMQVLGTMCLICMAWSASLQGQLLLFSIKGALMRCTEPLSRSILMDFVAREKRATWNSLESLSSLIWAGSLLSGGVLEDAYGYRCCFSIACILCLFGILVESILIPLTRHAREAF